MLTAEDQGALGLPTSFCTIFDQRLVRSDVAHLWQCQIGEVCRDTRHVCLLPVHHLRAYVRGYALADLLKFRLQLFWRFFWCLAFHDLYCLSQLCIFFAQFV